MKCENFSSLIRLLRITAWVQRFIRKLKKDTISGQLTAKEMEEAKFMWIVHIQRKHFAKEIHDITKNKSSNIIRQLGLTIDNNGFIRCVGRTEHADVFENAKRPILLPKKEAFTKLLIYSYHRNLLHVGVAQTLSQIRQKYWIPQGRSTVRHVLRTYGNCIRYKGGPYKMPLIPPLPQKKVTASSPYTYTAIDYFKAASNVVQQEWKKVLYDSDIQNYVSNKGINWKFIVELAPWMGGFYERLVGLAKRSLRKTMGKVCLSVEQLRTLLTEVEAVVNSRPLAYIGEDIDSNIVLTPSCFLTLNKHTGIPERIDNDEDPEYKPQLSSTDNLFEIWKKRSKTFKQILESASW
ncbi:unnamed protein product [Mytilus edulis]|uniref:Integrase zinc-binding domain-containing protein n=1 Tax=Mytilus edulis TaxID=6550 RepID=A0A8S3T9U5_MYTED|nr:unnamed protein product [Mytilus edulis]